MDTSGTRQNMYGTLHVVCHKNVINFFFGGGTRLGHTGKHHKHLGHDMVLSIKEKSTILSKETKMWDVEGDKFDFLDDVGILGVTMTSFEHEMDDGRDGNDNFVN